MKKLGLCLSGGGLRGIAHIGLIQAIEEAKLNIQAISGTSVGAIIGAFYAKGYQAKEMMEMVKENDFFSRKSFKFQRTGLFNPNILSNLFEKYLKEDSFESLKKPLYVAAEDIYTGKTVIFSEGKLFDKLRASAAVPFIFPVVEIDNELFCDGGILNNLPIEPLKEKNYFVIAAHVNSIVQLSGKGRIKFSTTAYLDRLFHLGLSSHVYLKKRDCDIFIEAPDLTKFSIFDKKDADKLFEVGYEYGLRAIDTLK